MSGKTIKLLSAAADRPSPERQTQPSERQFRYSDPASAVAEEGLIRLLYLEPSLASDERLPDASAFSAPVLGHIYTVLRDRLAAGREVSTAVLGSELSGEEISLLVNILQKPETLSNSPRALEDYIKRIAQRRVSSSDGDDLMKILENRRKELE